MLWLWRAIRAALEARDAAQPVSNAESITYTVHARDRGGWQPQGSTADMQTALTAARQLLGSKRFRQVKVDKQFYDRMNARSVTMTIYEEALARRRSLVMPLLIALALTGGLVSFAVTYYLMRGPL